MASISFGGTGTAIGNMTYAWDDNKNKTAESIAGTMTNYGLTIPSGGYDAEDRLVSFNRASGLTQAWGLSLVGDWNSVTTNGSAQTRTHGPSHELLTGAGQNVTTDVKGNITLIPAALRPNSTALTSTWDFDNRLSSAVSGSNTVSHKYDALGRRVARVEDSSTTVYVPSGQQTIADYTGGTAPSTGVNQYVYASYIDEPVMMFRKSAGGARIYYHRNQQYSVNALTDAAGTVVERYAYTAYGVPTIAAANGVPRTFSLYGNRYTYTGREWDSTIQQYHYRARMYDASLGRFCSKDPIWYKYGIPPNLYEYCDANALAYVDPLGLSTTGIEEPPGGWQIQQHHLFPQGKGTGINALCGWLGFSIHTFTTPVQGDMTRGSEHWWWQYGCGDYNEKVQDIIDKSSNCCDFMVDMVELISNTRECVSEGLKRKTIKPMETQPHGLLGNPNNWPGDSELIDLICNPPKNPPFFPEPLVEPVPIKVEEPEIEMPPIRHGYPPIWVPLPAPVLAPISRIIPALGL